MSLRLSSLTLKLCKSSDYMWLGLFIHASALGAMYRVHYSWASIILALVLLSLPMLKIIRYKMPHPDLLALSYHRRNDSKIDWLLQSTNGNHTQYEQMKILLSTGFFILIALRSKHHKRTLVIFNDQITSDELRMLHVIEKISRG